MKKNAKKTCHPLSRPRPVTNETVKKMLAFQWSGENFHGLWSDIGPIVEEFARRNLHSLNVRVRNSADDWAIDDVVSMTKLKLYQLCMPDAGGRFQPEKASQGGLSGLRGWLFKVVRSQAVEWVRENRPHRAVKIKCEADFPCNDLPSGDQPSSFLNRQPMKIDRAHLLPILEECISQLADPLHRELLRLKLRDGLSQRATAKKLGFSASTVYRHLSKTYALLRPMLEDHGTDVSAFLDL